ETRVLEPVVQLVVVGDVGAARRVQAEPGIEADVPPALHHLGLPERGVGGRHGGGGRSGGLALGGAAARLSRGLPAAGQNRYYEKNGEKAPLCWNGDSHVRSVVYSELSATAGLTPMA